MRISDWSSDVCSSDLELAFGQVAIDQPARVDAHGVARSVRVSVVIAAEQEGCPADQRDSADACEQGLLPLRDLVVEVAPANLTSAFRGGAGFSCFRGLGNRIGGRLVCVCHYSSPPLRTTRQALVTPPGPRTPRANEEQ